MKVSYAVLVAAVTVGSAFAHEHSSPAGRPGDAKSVDRIIAITAEDIKFEPTAITARTGETVKFVVTNHGKLTHEFVIGGKAAQEQHEQEMQSMGAMDHQDPNAVTIGPGETKALIWKFDRPGTFEYGCHVPGHYAAGMVGTVQVR